MISAKLRTNGKITIELDRNQSTEHRHLFRRELILRTFRNLALIRRLNEQPFVWILLEMIAVGKYACIVLDRDEITSYSRYEGISAVFTHCSMPPVRVNRSMGEPSRRRSSDITFETIEPFNESHHSTEEGQRRRVCSLD